MLESRTVGPIVRRTPLVTAPLASAPDRIEAYCVTLGPAQRSGSHLHVGGVTGYVVSGTIIFALDGAPERRLRAGDGFYEPPGRRVERFDNASTTTEAVFIAFYPLTGAMPLVTFVP